MDKQIKVGIGVMILREDSVLLGHRIGKDTGGIYEPGSWCLPGGKQEFGETFYEGAAREVEEETSLHISEMELFGAADDIASDRHFVTLWVVAGNCEGTARVTEPDKQDAWKWFPLDALPERIYGPSEKFIRAYLKKRACTIG